MVMFDVAYPTIRLPRCGENLLSVVSSLTHPTRFHVLTGEAGKMQTLNHHLPTMGDDVSIYVTIDDDIRLYPGWQEDIADAFHLAPQMGALGIDLSSTESGRRYILKAFECEAVPFGGLFIRDCTDVQNIGGACLAMRAEVARAIGPYPHAGARKNCIEEDSWRCDQVRSLGYRLGYVLSGRGQAVLQEFPDDPLADRVQKAIDAAEVGLPKLPESVLTMEGMSSAKVRTLLAGLHAQRYLEVGTWKGSTLASACQSSQLIEAVSVDDFSFEDTRECLKSSMASISGWRVVDGDFLAVPDSSIPYGVDVAFYDGSHEASVTAESVRRIATRLDRESVVLVDDTNYPGIRDAAVRGLQSAGVSIVRCWDLPARVMDGHDMEQWWNGLFVAVVRRY